MAINKRPFLQGKEKGRLYPMRKAPERRKTAKLRNEEMRRAPVSAKSLKNKIKSFLSEVSGNETASHKTALSEGRNIADRRRLKKIYKAATGMVHSCTGFALSKIHIYQPGKRAEVMRHMQMLVEGRKNKPAENFNPEVWFERLTSILGTKKAEAFISAYQETRAKWKQEYSRIPRATEKTDLMKEEMLGEWRKKVALN